MSNSLQPHGLQHSRLPCPSPSPGVYSNSCPSSQWCHPITSSFIIPFPSCLQSFPASGSFPTSPLFPSGSQSIEASASVLPVNIQGWLPIGKSPCCPRDSQESFPHHNSEASILRCSAFFTVHFSHQYITTGKTIALTIGICKPSLCQRTTPQDLWSLTPFLGETGGRWSSGTWQFENHWVLHKKAGTPGLWAIVLPPYHLKPSLGPRTSPLQDCFLGGGGERAVSYSFTLSHSLIQSREQRLPWWCSNKDQPANAGSMKFNPWSRKIPQVTELPSPHSRAQELQLLSPCAAAAAACTPRACALQEELLQWEAHTQQQKNGAPCSLQLEKALAKQQRPSAAKNEKK